MSESPSASENIFGIPPEQLSKIDMSTPVTRTELLQALLAVNVAVSEQARLVALVAGYNSHIPREMIVDSIQHSGKALDFAIQIMKDWGAASGG